MAKQTDWLCTIYKKNQINKFTQGDGSFCTFYDSITNWIKEFEKNFKRIEKCSSDLSYAWMLKLHYLKNDYYILVLEKSPNTKKWQKYTDVKKSVSASNENISAAIQEALA